MAVNIGASLRRSRWALPMTLLCTLAAALLVVAVNELAHRRAAAALAALDLRVELRRDVQLLLRLIGDAESGQRGYLLTGRAEHLEPYQRSLDGVRALSARIATGYADDGPAQPLVQAIATAADTRVSEMETVLSLHAQGRHEAWQALLGSNIGKEQMDTVRSASEQLFALETARIVAGRDDVARTLAASRFGLSAMAALAALALVLFLRRSAALDAVQRRHAAELQAERDQLEREVERRTAELSELAQHLQTVREDERARLARELHDELGALLTAAKLDTARLKRSLGGPVAESEARLAHLGQTINRGIELKRQIIEDLRPSALDTLGLGAALDILAREFAQRSELQVQTELQPMTLDDRHAITVYRLVQEALTNIAKHARAHSVSVRLHLAAGPPAAVTVEVADDGSGFDPAAVPGSRHGLLGMRQRVQALGGSLQVHSRPGGGTRLHAWLPQAQPRRPMQEQMPEQMLEQMLEDQAQTTTPVQAPTRAQASNRPGTGAAAA